MMQLFGVLPDQQPSICRVHYRKISAEMHLAALSEVFSALPSPAILGANAAKVDADGHSYWTAGPREVHEFTPADGDPFPRLAGVLSRYRLADDSARDRDDTRPQSDTDRPRSSEGLFCGGWVGFFSYELGRYIERLPETATDDLHMPLIRLGFYDRVIAFDHRTDTVWLIALEIANDRETPEEKFTDLKRCLDRSRQIHHTEPPCADVEAVDLAGVRDNVKRDACLEAVQRIKDYIRDGEVYQVNFSHRLDQPFTGRPIDLYHWENRYNPSGYAAYLDTGRFQIVSASPEMFITIHNGRITTKPIKGTRPRLTACDPATSKLNRERFDDLLTSEKEQAELNMIVDLERNDVARICKPGTRRVMQPRTVETYPTVYHAVATVGGELREDVQFADVLKAMFPGGSITGAPKVRAMEIIDELEPTARGIYTGSIGFLSLNGDVCLNIAIRTVIIASGRAFVQVGGGIVADSDPQAEWDETMTKAGALLAGIRAVGTEGVARPSPGTTHPAERKTKQYG